MKLSVVIPAHNEQACIGGTVRALYSVLKTEQIEHEIVVINDNSSDLTEQILLALCSEISTLKVINNDPPHGFGFAVRKGLDSYTGDAVAIYMADASDRPEDLVKFWRVLEQDDVDCVFGTRFSRRSQLVDYPFHKLILNRLANTFIQVIFGLRYNDVTNAFKLYRSSVIEGLKPLLSHHFNLTVELPLKSIVRGYSYAVVPNDWINRKTGVSKLLVQEMGSRYLFIVLYCFIEKWLSKRDYHREKLLANSTLAQATAGEIRAHRAVANSRKADRAPDAEFDRPSKLLIVAIFVACLIWSVFMATVGWRNSISDAHGFRQTQTAITSYYLARGGPFLSYETPVFGYPWSLPFEFPLYQGLVAFTSKTFHIQLDQSGRLISEVFFALCLVALWGILSELRVARVHRLIFLSLVLVSPQYVFWSRTFMIESTALFFSLAYLYFILRYVRTKRLVDAGLGGLCGVLGALVKVTTFPAFALVGGTIYLYGAYRDYDSKQRLKLARLLWPHLVAILFFACLPVLIAWRWVVFTDHVKALNLVAGPFLSSANLRTWNFGTLAQRFRAPVWIIMRVRTIPSLIGAPIGLLVSGLSVLLSRHRIAPFLLSIAGFLSAFLIFTNLHYIHSYYAYANGIFLVAAVSWGIVGLLEGIKWRKFLGVAVFLFCIFLSLQRYYDYTYEIQHQNADHFDKLAAEIKKVTQPKDVVLIFSNDWSPEIPYFSERRALIWPRWMEQDMDAVSMKEALSRLGDNKIGAIAFCEGAQRNSHLIERAIDSLKMSPNADYEDELCTVYRSAETRAER